MDSFFLLEDDADPNGLNLYTGLGAEASAALLLSTEPREGKSEKSGRVAFVFLLTDDAAEDLFFLFFCSMVSIIPMLSKDELELRDRVGLSTGDWSSMRATLIGEECMSKRADMS
jgi:hypothetical protein